jgi:hypothetical protein
MKWLTPKQIERRAQKSMKEALLVSIAHHQQIVSSTLKEFFAGVAADKTSISADFCGLCQRMERCEDCPLHSQSDCCEEWRAIRSAITNLFVGDGSWPKVIRDERTMIRRLKEELRIVKKGG